MPPIADGAAGPRAAEFHSVGLCLICTGKVPASVIACKGIIRVEIELLFHLSIGTAHAARSCKPACARKVNTRG